MQQVAACKSLLQALSARPGFADVSASECSRLLGLLRPLHLSSAELAAFASAVVEAGFAAKDQGLILDAVAQASSGQAALPRASLSGSTRAKQQSWESAVHFIPGSVWKRLEEHSVAELLDFIVRLGLRSPTEHTLLALSCCVLAVSEGVDKSVNMSVDNRLVFHQTVKTMFKEKVKFAPSPLVWVQELPASPEQFKRSYSALWEALYASEAPCSCPVSELSLAQLKAISRCREVRKGSLKPTAAGSELFSVGAASQPGPQQAFMQMGMSIINSISQLQQQLGKGSSSSADGSPGLRIGSSPSKDAASSGLRLLQSASSPTLASAAAVQNVAAPVLPVAPSPAPPAAALADPAEDATSSGLPAAAGKMDEYTQEILAKLASKKGKGEVNAKAKVKSKAKAKASTSGKAASSGKATLSSKASTKGQASSSSSPPPCPRKGKHPPVHFLTCVIYSDTSSSSWRALEKSNKRHDRKFKWESPNAWSHCLAWCREASRAARGK